MTKTPERDLYSILGVDPHATPDEVRASYIARARIAHPDRFDKQRNAEDWRKANEMLAELNDAYAVVGDASRRREYDCLRAARSSSHQSPPPSPRRDSPPVRPSPFEHGDLTSGHAKYSDLPKHVQERLVKRQEGTEKNQFQIRLTSVVRNYVFIIVLLGWFLYLFGDAAGARWSHDTLLWHGGLTLAVGLLIGRNVVAIVRWSKATLKPCFYVTPVYFITTEFDIVTFRPIWSLKDVAVTHNYRNGSYQDSDVVLKFDGHDELLSLSPKARVEAMFEFMKACDARLRAAFQSGSYDLLAAHDDFAGVPRTGIPTNVLLANRTRFAIYALSVIVCGVGLLVAARVNTKSADARWVRHPTPSTYTPSPPQRVARPSVPQQPLPQNGNVRNFTEAERLAPFEIKAAHGSHYLLKMVNARTGKPVLTVFVHSGSTVNIDVPLGTYEVRYASGGLWYGDEYLFGPDTAYSKADTPFTFEVVGNQVNGFTITLYSVPYGNLHTSAIRATEF